MFLYCGKTHGVVRCQVRDRLFAHGDLGDDVTSCRVRERLEEAIDLRITQLIYNHVVVRYSCLGPPSRGHIDLSGNMECGRRPSSAERSAKVRIRSAMIGALLIVLGALVVLVLDLHTAWQTPSHLRRTISEYGLGAQQWVFSIGVVLLALGSALTLVSAIRHRLTRPGAIASIFLTLWTLGLIAVVAVPKQDWSNDASLSLGGTIHRLGAAVAFVSIPVAVFTFSRPWLRDTVWAVRARVTMGLSALSVVTLMPIVYALAVGATGSRPWYRVVTLGYVERVLVVAEVIALISLALWVWAAERRSRTSKATRELRASQPV